MPTNAWGDPVEESLAEDPWHVPEAERETEDFPDQWDSNALDEETGDDLDGWEPGDPV